MRVAVDSQARVYPLQQPPRLPAGQIHTPKVSVANRLSYGLATSHFPLPTVGIVARSGGQSNRKKA